MFALFLHRSAKLKPVILCYYPSTPNFHNPRFLSTPSTQTMGGTREGGVIKMVGRYIKNQSPQGGFDLKGGLTWDGG